MDLWSRKRDLIYFGFFAIHIPIIFLVDAAPLLPEILRTNASFKIREYYVSTYHDKFIEGPVPAWFTCFQWMELCYHVPLSIWALGALWRDDPLIPVHLLVFGMQSFVTTLTCLVEVWNWDDRTVVQKQNISMLYGPYVALGAFIALDMYLRLRVRLLVKSKRE